MSLIGVINKNPEVRSKIEQSFRKDKTQHFILHHASALEEAQELLNFDLPEIVIINATDPDIPLDDLVKHIRDDAWLHNFGIIALYDRKLTGDNELAAKLKEINLLTTVDYGNIVSNLYKNIEIIEKNRQIIFQWEMVSTLSQRITGSFIIENDPMEVPVYAGLAATALVQRGFLSQEKKRNLQIALAELVQNGIEHGNCEVGFEEKTKFLLQGGSIADLIAEKCTNPEIAARKVHLEWDIQADHTRFFVRDEGRGFDVVDYQNKMKSIRRDELHGRGILLAKSFGGKLSYNTKGNVAVLTVMHESQELRPAPMGFQGEEVLLPQKGDVIFQQGEVSDHIYYISSGQYSVWHDGIQIGFLTPADIFMGEMSFLLNNARSASIIAESPGKIIKIARKSFVSSIRNFPQYGLFLAKLLARKLSGKNRASSKQAKENLAT